MGFLLFRSATDANSASHYLAIELVLPLGYSPGSAQTTKLARYETR